MLSLLKARVTNTPTSRVELLFVLFLLIFGIPMIVLIPPGAGYDEEDHLVRVWELSALSFIPGQLSPRELQYPILFRDFSYRQQGSLGVIENEFWQKYARASFYEYGIVRREIDTKSVYSPALLLPQANVLRLFGRDTSVPALTVFYACRFASLVSYLVLVWVAIRLIPFGKWILTVLALTPMALFQATTISPDAISNGIGFLFIAGSLRAAQFKEIDWKEVLGLLLLAFLLFLAKLNLVPLILLPFLIIPPARFTQKGVYIFLVAMTLILFLVEVAGWNLIAATRSDPLLANEADPKAQLLYILSYPLSFLITIIQDFITNGWTYFQGWINGYGYYYWTPPPVVSILFLLGLGAALLIDSTREQVDRKYRLAFILVFVAGYLATIASLYLTFTPLGSDQILGVQGRYFVPLALLIFLAFSSPSWTRKISVPSFKWTVIPLGIALFLNVLGIYLSFHVPCGAAFYQTGLCYRPLSRDFSTTRASSPISNGVALTQEVQVRCDGLTEIRVVLGPSSTENQGFTRFVLQDPMSNHTLLNTVVANDQISADDWHHLRFEPVWDSAGRQYLLRIHGEDVPTGQGLRILYTTQSEFDLGELNENGQPLEEDIALQYGCTAGLRKIWLTGEP